MFSKVLELISKYGLHSGIFVKMNFTLSLAKKYPNKMKKNSIAKTYSR